MIDYEQLKLKLLKFSEYKILDKKAKDIKCVDIQNELRKYRNQPNQDKKYIHVYIVSNGKVIEEINNRFDKFNLDFFDKYINEKNNLQIVVYLFDTKYRKINMQYTKFLFFYSLSKLQEINFLKFFVFPISFFSSLTLLFIYFGLTEYGIPINLVNDLSSISFLIMSASVILILILIFIFLIFMAIILILAYFCKDVFPKLYRYSYLTSSYVVLVVPILIVIPLFLLFMGKSILATFISNNTFDKSGYAIVMSEYYYHYSGYPKLLKKNNKYYYLPIKDKKNYYVYDIDNVKKRYIQDLKEEQLKKICKNDNAKKSFIDNYIVNNPYIKPAHQTKIFNINDENISIEDFNMSKLISKEDIKKLCK